jgi:hypothetical protein
MKSHTDSHLPLIRAGKNTLLPPAILKLQIALLIVMFLGLFSAVQAQPLTLPFTYYDYDDVILSGRSATATYFFRVPGDIDLSGSYIDLDMGWSEVLLMNRSFVSIRVNDLPVTSRRLSSDPRSIRIPLAGTVLFEDNFIKLEIGTDVTITDDRCEDILFNTMWLTISRNSMLHIRRTGAVSTPTIASYVPGIRHIGIPDNPSLDDIEAAAWLVAFLEKTWGNRSAVITTYEEALMHSSGSVLLGMKHVLPDTITERLSRTTIDRFGLMEIIRREYRTGNTMNRYRHLVVTGTDSVGYRKAIHTLLDRNQVSTAFANDLVISQAIEPYDVQSRFRRNTLTLQDLGAAEVRLQGIGTMKTQFNFSLNDFGYFPQHLDLLLNASYSSIDRQDRGIMNIYLNDFLLSSQRLDQSGYVRHQTRLRRDQLLPFNTLTIEFVYYPPQMSCETTAADFNAQVDIRNSRLTGGREQQPDMLSFHHFPTVFYQSDTAILIDPGTGLPTINAMAKMIGYMNTNIHQRMVLYPRIKYHDQVSQDFIRTRPIIGYNTRGSDMFSRFSGKMANIDQHFRVYSEALGRDLFAVSDTASVGIAQIFRENGQPVLLLTASGNQIGSGHRYISSVITDQRFRLTNNLGVASRNEHHLFNINEYTGIISDRDDGFWQYWFGRFGFLFLIAVLILIVFGYMAIRRSVLEARKQFQ